MPHCSPTDTGQRSVHTHTSYLQFFLHGQSCWPNLSPQIPTMPWQNSVYYITFYFTIFVKTMEL